MNFEEYMNSERGYDNDYENSYEDDYEDDYEKSRKKEHGHKEDCYKDEHEEKDDYSKKCGCFEYKHCECCECNDGCLEDTIDTSCICKPVCKKMPVMGRLIVRANLNCADGEPISNLSVTLFRVDNGCEKKVATKKTDKNGCVEFTCLEDGLYQVEQNIDPCLFECAEFYPANQFCISKKTKCQKIHIINKLKKIDPCLLKFIDKAVERAVRKALCRCKCRRGC